MSQKTLAGHPVGSHGFVVWKGTVALPITATRGGIRALAPSSETRSLHSCVSWKGLHTLPDPLSLELVIVTNILLYVECDFSPPCS